MSAARLGRYVAHRTVGRFFDVREGWRLMRSREVSWWLKLIALAIGVAVCGVMLYFEAPLEAVVAVLMPGVGGIIDLAIDGAEVVMLPMLVACAILPLIARNRNRSAAN